MSVPALIRHQPIVLTPNELYEALPQRQGIAYVKSDTGVWVAGKTGQGFHITASTVLADHSWPSILERIHALSQGTP